MKCLVAFALAAGLIATTADSKDEAVKKMMKKLEGTWHPSTLEHNGRTFQPSQKWSLVLKGDRYKMTIGEMVEKGTFKIDPTAKPATVDVTPTEGAYQGKTRKGIFQLDGDEAKACFAIIDREERPTEFISPAGSENYVWTFVRETK